MCKRNYGYSSDERILLFDRLKLVWLNTEKAEGRLENTLTKWPGLDPNYQYQQPIGDSACS
jgi:hypothetical protein